MNLEELRTRLKSVDCNKSDSLTLGMVEKRKNGLTVYLPETAKNLRKQIIELLLYSMSQKQFKLRQVKYNESFREDDTIEYSNTDLANISLIIDNISNQENREQDLKDLNLDKINYYFIEFGEGEEKVIFFRRFNKFKKLRLGIPGYFSGNNFVKLDKEIAGLDNDIDLIVFKNEVLILNRFSLQLIFDLTDYFREKTKQAMKDLQSYDKIVNFQDFKEHCINDGSNIKRLTKIVNTPNLITGFFQNFENLENVIEQADLDIKLDSKGNIDYQGTRTERNQILSCIADSYYITLLQGNIGEDKF